MAPLLKIVKCVSRGSWTLQFIILHTNKLVHHNLHVFKYKNKYTWNKIPNSSWLAHPKCTSHMH